MVLGLRLIGRSWVIQVSLAKLPKRLELRWFVVGFTQCRESRGPHRSGAVPLIAL